MCYYHWKLPVIIAVFLFAFLSMKFDILVKPDNSGHCASSSLLNSARQYPV